MIDLIQAALLPLGYQVTGVMDGQEGLRAMRARLPDLVLLDLMLPGFDGWQVREAMLSDAALAGTPVVLVTAHARPSSSSASRPFPAAAACLSKPFRLAELRSLVRQVLDERRGTPPPPPP